MRKKSLLVLQPNDLETAAESAVGSGNEKLGSRIGTFSLPAIHTCHLGSTETCRSRCYADSGHFVGTNVQRRYSLNLAFTRRPDFVAKMLARIQKKERTAFRWHVAGDLYSVEYAVKLAAVMLACPKLPMFIYTRTWRNENMRPVLRLMAGLPNVQLWLSCDQDTGEPVDIPGARRAYMQVENDPGPAYSVDLVFRDKPVRTASVAKRVAGAVVCPVENGTKTDITCEKCRICFTDPAVDPTRRTTGRFTSSKTEPTV